MKAISGLNESLNKIIIAGPCSAESEEQLLQTASELKSKISITYFRAGVWKPRSTPNSFQGIGEKALTWLKKVQDEVGVPVCTEVANARHIEQALKNDIKVLWIGARTTTSPFIVEELAQHLKGSDVVVMIKNPMAADLKLWLGAVERFEKVGLKNIMAIHRGFPQFQERLYRNSPQWGLAIEFKRLRPDIPLLCDPSHIAGKRELIPDIISKAYELQYQGIMVETHLEPEKALSDADQQITPTRLAQIITNMTPKQNVVDNPEVVNKLSELRSRIDHIDLEISQQLSERFKLVDEIHHLKMKYNISTLQLDRFNQVLERQALIAEEKNLDKTFIADLFKLIHEESINLQLRQ